MNERKQVDIDLLVENFAYEKEIDFRELGIEIPI